MIGLGLWLGLRFRVKVMVRVRVGFRVRIRVNLTLTLTKTLNLNPNLLSYWECCQNMVRKKNCRVAPANKNPGYAGVPRHTKLAKINSVTMVNEFKVYCCHGHHIK